MAGERFSVVRPDDLLVLDVELVNLVVDGDRLARADRSQPAHLLVHLPPQHVLEASIGVGEVPPKPLPAFVAGPSRLVLTLADGVDEIEFSVEGILTWWPPGRLGSQTVPRSFPPDDPDDPTTFNGLPVTAIEFPSRLLICHENDARWWHRTRPFTADGRTEVWHTRLVPVEGPPAELRLRAFGLRRGRPARPWSLPTEAQLEDVLFLVNTEEIPPPVQGPVLEAANRLGIDQSLAWQLIVEAWQAGSYRPQPLYTERFMLTALGASVRMRGQWDYPDVRHDVDAFVRLLRELGVPDPAVEHYHHVAGLGRDQYVRVVERGRLHTGHRAAITEIRERVFDTDEKGWPVAALVRRRFITVQEPEVRYGGRDLPFVSLRITDTVTPPLAADTDERAPFWIRLDSGQDHLFTVIGTDSRGGQVTFTLPAVFVPASASLPDPVYRDGPEERRTRPLGNQVVALADDGGATTSFPVGSMTFGLPDVAALTMAKAAVLVPAVEELTGEAAEQTVTYLQAYVDDGLEHAASGAFLALTGDGVPLDLGADQVGGLAGPAATLNTISSRGGVLPDALATAGTFTEDQLAAVFAGARLLGSVSLAKVLAAVTTPLDAAAFPSQQELTEEMRSRLAGAREPSLPVPILRTTRVPDGTELQYLWKPALRSVDLAGLGRLDLDRAWLVLDARTLRGTGGTVTTTVTGTLRAFAIDFAGVAKAEFEELTFTSRPGVKPDVSARGVELTFQGELDFVNELQKLLPKDCFGAGSLVEVTPEGVKAGYALAVPTVQVGVFNLQNLVVSAVLTIPFGEEPTRLRFALSERHSPFVLTVMAFGGGGFFALEVGTEGVVSVEGALEFGGSVALDLGVASGGVYLMGGVYFRWTDGSAKVTGYVRCGGYLSVLGIVSVSVEFYLALEYEKKTIEGQKISVVRGVGGVTLSVRVLFFSKTVTLSLEKSFEGSPGDPTFEECVEPADWDAYCLAFAG
ncbi:hypothetical protein ACIBI3_11150 [Actinomadura luteofluorescens]|uniref:hypothetical protein n=1 Tax=Actinomadura luteofluorescens TaxID=46163 RepID=UPI003491E52F